MCNVIGRLHWCLVAAMGVVSCANGTYALEDVLQDMLGGPK